MILLYISPNASFFEIHRLGYYSNLFYRNKHMVIYHDKNDQINVKRIISFYVSSADYVSYDPIELIIEKLINEDKAYYNGVDAENSFVFLKKSNINKPKKGKYFFQKDEMDYCIFLPSPDGEKTKWGIGLGEPSLRILDFLQKSPNISKVISSTYESNDFFFLLKDKFPNVSYENLKTLTSDNNPYSDESVFENYFSLEVLKNGFIQSEFENVFLNKKFFEVANRSLQFIYQKLEPFWDLIDKKYDVLNETFIDHLEDRNLNDLWNLMLDYVNRLSYCSKSNHRDTAYWANQIVWHGRRLGLFESKNSDEFLYGKIPYLKDSFKNLMEKRNIAKIEKNFTQMDMIKQYFKDKGIVIEDANEDQFWRKGLKL